MNKNSEPEILFQGVKKKIFKNQVLRFSGQLEILYTEVAFTSPKDAG